MVMKERFLAGEDGRHFDYRLVDECDRYDDGEQVRGARAVCSAREYVSTRA